MSRQVLIKRIAFSAAAALAVLIFTEAGLRVAGFHFRHESYMQFNFPNPNELYQVFEPDPALLWRMRPGFDFGEGFSPLNARGFRGRDFKKEAPAGVLRIACMGDSVTFGRAGADFPALMERMLSARLGKPVEVMNFGVPGYSSWQGKVLLERVLADYSPRIVIIMFGWNDHWLAKGFADQDQVVNVETPPESQKILRGLRIYQLMEKATAAARKIIAPPPRIPRVSLDDYGKNLAAMIEMCGRAGALPIIAVPPSAIGVGIQPDYLTALDFIEPGQDLAKLHESYSDAARRVALENNIPLTDLGLIFESHDVTSLFEDPKKDLIHPNAEGYRLLAESLSTAIVDQIGKWE